MTRAIVVVPCYNEAKRLNMRAIQDFGRRSETVELLFVNDGSRDETLELLEQLHQGNPRRFSFLHLAKNGGKAEAVRQGVLLAIHSGAEYVGFWDADLATPLSDIEPFCRVLDTRPAVDAVIGTRLPLLGIKIERRPLRRFLAGRLFANTASLALGVRIFDTQCGAKLFRVTPQLSRYFSKPFLTRWIFDVEILARWQAVRRRGDPHSRGPRPQPAKRRPRHSRDRLVVITGPSGSGKSSLAFDTLFAEGQRQYIESLSVYARQFLHQMERPDVDLIEGLQPTISIDQRAGSQNPRSTVATVTEIYDYLRLLFARLGEPVCYRCGEPIRQQSPEQILDELVQLPPGTKVMVMAPLVRGRKGQHKDVFAAIRKAGFVRVRVDGEVVDVDQVRRAGPAKKPPDRSGRRPDRDSRRNRSAAGRIDAVAGHARRGAVVVSYLEPAARPAKPAGQRQRARLARAALQHAVRLPALAKSATRSWSRARSASTAPTAPARPAKGLGSRRAVRSGAGAAGRQPVAGRRRDRGLERGHAGRNAAPQNPTAGFSERPAFDWNTPLAE